jgi:hypothetical protein
MIATSDNTDCHHNAVLVAFDEQAAKGLSADEVRKRWPRFFGICPDCGDRLIKYASWAHFTSGDW